MHDEPRLHVEVDGTGPIVLLAHGFGGSARNFRPQARALAARYRVVRWDARGHARSGAPSDCAAYAPHVLVADVGRVLDRVGATTAVVGGLSMGAAVTLQFTLAHPERVRGLVLAGFPPGPAVAGSFTALAGTLADAIEREGLEAAGARWVWGEASGLDPASARLVRQGFLEHSPRGLACTLRSMPALIPTPEDLRRVHVPALVVVGAEDRLSLAASRALGAALPGARLEVVPDAGHVVNLAQPAAFNAALVRFLDALPA
ncbi:MAG TPA: alpha/beta fold hydrolase [Candidatus Binatia bacterium]|nr:alpha/beta fold hydrolase [Candidatus Binatia bacterium]